MADGDDKTTNNSDADQNKDGGNAPENKDQQDSTQSGTPTDGGKKTDTDDAKGGDDAKTPAELESARRVIAEQRKKLKEFEDAKAEAEKAELEKKGEHEKLAKQAEERAAKAEERFKTAQADNKLIVAASAAGIKDTDAALKLVDRNKVEVDDDGNVTGAEDAMNALVEAKPWLKNAGTDGKTPVGAGHSTENTEDNEVQEFTESQIAKMDAKEFEKNEKAIMAAMRAGKIKKG